MKDAAQGVAEDVPQDVAQDLAFGARAAHALLATPPPPPLPSFCAACAEMGGAIGQLSGIGLGLWASASGGAAQSASVFITLKRFLGQMSNHKARAKHSCLDPSTAHSNPITRVASPQQSRFVRSKLARTQKLRSEKGCSQHYLGELHLIRGTGTALRTGVEAAAGVAGVAGAAAGAAAGARWLKKAIASNMHDHRGRQHKQQRARLWILMVYLRRQERWRHKGQPRTVQRRRHF